MPVAKKASKKPNTKLKTNNVTGQKKVLALTVLAFALVGVVMLIRSYAATTVVSFNPTAGMGAATLEGFSYTNAKVVSETSNDKKPNTAKFAEITYTTTNPTLFFGQLKYTTKLNQGNYRFCATIKPTVASSTGSIMVSKPGSGQSYAFHGIGEKSSENYRETTPYNTSFSVNQKQDVCVAYAVSATDSGKSMDYFVDSTKGTWRVSNMSISSYSDREVSSSALVSAASFDSPWGIGIPPNDSVTIYGERGTMVNIIKDTVSGMNKDVVSLKEGNGSPTINLFRSNYPSGVVDPKKQYNFCVLVKALNTNASNKFNLSSYSANAGPIGRTIEISATANDSVYNTKCITDLTLVTTSNGSVGGSAYTTDTNSSWYFADAWIEVVPR